MLLAFILEVREEGCVTKMGPRSYEFFPVGEFYSHVLFPSRFFLDLEPTSLSQIIVHLHAEFSEPFGVTLAKAVWEEKVSLYHQLAMHLSGTEGCPGNGNFQSLNRESPGKLGWLAPHNVLAWAP